MCYTKTIGLTNLTVCTNNIQKIVLDMQNNVYKVLVVNHIHENSYTVEFVEIINLYSQVQTKSLNHLMFSANRVIPVKCVALDG